MRTHRIARIEYVQMSEENHDETSPMTQERAIRVVGGKPCKNISTNCDSSFRIPESPRGSTKHPDLTQLADCKLNHHEKGQQCKPITRVFLERLIEAVLRLTGVRELARSLTDFGHDGGQSHPPVSC